MSAYDKEAALIDQATQDGIEIGIKKGKSEGILERNKEIVLNMLEEKIDIKVITKVTGLTESEIKKLKSQNG